MPEDRTTIVAVISDMGTRGPAVAQFKAAVVAVNPRVEFVDVTHEVRPRDLLEAAFTLERCYRAFPTRTVFAVMVEPLRGANSRPLLAVSMDYYYFAPDNGVLSFIYRTDPPSSVYHITAEHYQKLPPGPLSAHRDTYGTAIGWLTKGIESTNFGEPITDFVQTKLPAAGRAGERELKGMALHVDHFGTLVTNIHEHQINEMRHALGAQVPFQAVVGQKGVPVVGGFVEGGPDPFAVYGPSGYLEIAASKGDAAKLLDAKRGDAVSVVFGG